MTYRHFSRFFFFLLLHTFPPLWGGPHIDFLKASLQGNRSAMEKLLDREGTHLAHLRDKKRNTPLHLVIYSRKDKEVAALIQLLLNQGADPNAANAHFTTPLHLAVEANNANAAEALLSCPKIQPNLLNERSYTPLHEALYRRLVPLIDLLLDSPALFPDTPTCDGATPLHFAAMWGFYSEAKKILDHPLTNPNAAQIAGDYQGGTPLHFAALQAQHEIVALLLAKEADVTAAISHGLFKGFTPLHFAVMNPDTPNALKTASLLLQAGANPRVRSALGKLPIDLTNIATMRTLLSQKQSATRQGALLP